MVHRTSGLRRQRVVLRRRVRRQQLPSIRHPLGQAELERVVLLVRSRIVYEDRALEVAPGERTGVFVVGDQPSRVVRRADDTVAPGIWVRHRNVVGVVRPQHIQRTGLVEAALVNAADAEGQIRGQLPLQRDRQLIDSRLLFGRIRHRIACERSRVADDASKEVGTVWIEVDFSGVVIAVAVQIAPPVTRNRGDERIELEDLVLRPHVIESPPSALYDSFPRGSQVVRGVQPRRQRIPDLRIDFVDARGGRELPRCAALRRNEGVVVAIPDTEVQREPAANPPGVGPVHPHVVSVRPRGRRIVVGLDLEWRAVVEGQTILPGLTARVVLPPDLVPDVIESRLEFVVAGQQIRAEPRQPASRVVTLRHVEVAGTRICPRHGQCDLIERRRPAAAMRPVGHDADRVGAGDVERSRPPPAPELQRRHQRLANDFPFDLVDMGAQRRTASLRTRSPLVELASLGPGVLLRPMHEPDEAIRRVQLGRDLAVEKDLALIGIAWRAVGPERSHDLAVLVAVPRCAVEPDLLADDSPAEIAALIGLTEQRVTARDALRRQVRIDVVALQVAVLVPHQTAAVEGVAARLGHHRDGDSA